MRSIKTARSHVVALTLAAAGAIAVISGTLAFALTFENENPLAEARERAEETAIARGRAQLGDPLPGEAAGLMIASSERIRTRTAPAASVDPRAYLVARSAAQKLAVLGGPWSEVTSQPYDSDAFGYRDPVWSNSGGGAGNVAGMVKAIAIKGTTIFAGTNEGGVWRSTNGGVSWTPTFDQQPTLSIGAVAINPTDGSVWAGTGTPDDYIGAGVYRSTDDGATWEKVGGPQIDGAVIGRLAFDEHGTVLAASSKGIWRHSTTSTSGDWSAATIMPTPTPAPYGRYVFANDIKVRPGTDGKEMVASIAWRGGTTYDGFYQSSDGGNTFVKIENPGGAVNAKDVRRTTFAYSSDGKILYSLVQSAVLYDTSRMNGNTTLNGIYVSKTGSAAGPWNKIAEYRKLQQADSALKINSKGYSPGVQAWYDQFLAVDPKDANHVYVGLEEVFETTDGGSSWSTIGPYWNFTLPCAKNGLETCGKTTHPDQHAIAFSEDGSTVFVGNDGGIYSRPVRNATQWANLNEGLHSLLYYYAGSGHITKDANHPVAGEAFWGGLQDNGVSLLNPDAAAMVSPFGGDGGDVIVNPANADQAVVEYVDLTMALTTNGGRSDGSANSNSFIDISPSCSASAPPTPCDDNPRFIAPFEADARNINHWVAGGRYVWDNESKGWATRCAGAACDWKHVRDLGAGHSTTGLGVDGTTIYAGWCGPCNPAATSTSLPFGSGVDTNASGKWERVPAPANRMITSFWIDPKDPLHVISVASGYSRTWVESAGVGHVFESKDGGANWKDLSGKPGIDANALPDAPGDDILVVNGQMVVATDVGVFVATLGTSSWSRLGDNLPNAVASDLSLTSDGSKILVGTYGRGLWTIPVPAAK